MARDWFLCNGKDGKANVINLLDEKGNLCQSFPDISSLDLVTMELTPKNARNILGEFNNNVDLSGKFYDISHHDKKGTNKAYPTIFDLSSIKAYNGIVYCMDNLKYFAEQRQFKCDKNMELQLDNNKELQKCINKTMHIMTSMYYDELTTYESMLPLILKKLLVEYQNNTQNINYFINSRSGILYNIYSSYPALRNILLELMLCTLDKDPNIRNMFTDRNKWKVSGIGKKSYQQLSLFNNNDQLTRTRK